MIDSQDELFETRDYRSIEIYNSSNRDRFRSFNRFS